MSASGKIMNCEEFKVAITADPSFSNDDGHAAACTACADLKSQMLALNESIANAMAIEVPALRMPELPAIGAGDDKVVRLAARRKPTFSMPTWIGIAASFAIAALIGLQFLPDDSISEEALAEEVLAHIDHEPWALRVTHEAVSGERVRDVMAANGGTMDAGIGLVSYAQSCVINGRTIPHLVIQGQYGPVTILLMPEEMVSEPIALHGQSIDGVILPLGDGSVAIVGERGIDLDDVREKVTNSVEWSI